MADRYDYARSRNIAKLAEFNTGVITLTRTTRAAPDTDAPWVPGEATSVDVYTLDARVDGVSADFVDGTLILATDRVVIASPVATDADGAAVSIVPLMSDTLQIDGAAAAIKRIEAVPSAGDAVRFNIYIGS